MEFHEIMPHKKRIQHLVSLSKMGAESAGYHNGGITLAMPRGTAKLDRITRYMNTIGFKRSSLCLFPLGTDAPAEHLRHYGPYCQPGRDRPAYWLYAAFVPDNTVKEV